MKTAFHSAPFKFFIAFLASLSLLFTALFGTASLVMEADRIFDEDYKTDAQQSAEYAAEGQLHTAILQHLTQNQNDTVSKDFVYLIVDEQGSVLKDTGIREAKYPVSCYFAVKKGEDPTKGFFLSERELSHRNLPSSETHSIYRLQGGFLPSSLHVKAVEKAEASIAKLRPWQQPAPFLAAGGLVLTAFFSVLLCLGAGRKREGTAVVLNRADRIPLDLVLIGLSGIGIGLAVVMYAIGKNFEELSAVLLIYTTVLCEIASLLFFWLLYTVAARIKAGTVLKNTVLYRILCWIWKICKKTGTAVAVLLRKIPAVPGAAAVMGFLGICNIILGLMSRDAGVFILLSLEWIALFAVAILIAVQFSYLQKKTKELTQGKLQETVNTKLLTGPLKEQGEDLNRIREGLDTAVKERIKSERMKTELITNVSHDIKTPLTSIINYTDLLSKEADLTKTATEYIEVLRRQSSRLKKLTEDVLEVSKASSGTLTMEFTPCNLNVLLEQTAGEYEERTAEKRLSVILSLPEKTVNILADGRRLWRVLENLMNNICKYALENTRVYLTLTEEKESAVISFRNISKDPLNIAPKELTERFVRGDPSRNTEGSGLGLAIAQSLTEMQKGTFRIDIDGDLFKTTLTFPLLSQE